MRKVFKSISRLLLALIPLAVAVALGFIIYRKLPLTTGLLLIIGLVILAFWMSFKIYKKVKTIDLIEFISAVHASPDLDNIEPTKDCVTTLRTPKELSELIKTNKHQLKGGSFRIYGEWFGKPYDNYHSIQSGEYNEDLNLLTLNFNQGEKLEIYHPYQILEAPSFLKIIKADKIKLSYPSLNSIESEKKINYLKYQLKDNKFSRETNITVPTANFNTSLGSPALMIYN